MKNLFFLVFVFVFFQCNNSEYDKSNAYQYDTVKTKNKLNSKLKESNEYDQNTLKEYRPTEIQYCPTKLEKLKCKPQYMTPIEKLMSLMVLDMRYYNGNNIDFNHFDYGIKKIVSYLSFKGPIGGLYIVWGKF